MTHDARLDGPRPPPAVDRIVAGAREEFHRSGVAETSMETVATVVGLSRGYVYRLVGSREGLLELAVVARCRELGQGLVEDGVAQGLPLVDAFAAQVLAAVLRGRGDPELRALAGAIDRVRLGVVLTSRDSPVHALNLALFAPLLGRATTEGLLRTDRSVDRAVEWLQTSMTMLTARDDQDESETLAMIRDFILPGVLFL